MQTQGPLAGVKVFDLSRILAGPYATQMMADLGADVVKIEPPSGDDTRRFGPPFIEGESTYFLSVNRGKRSIILDLKKPEAGAIVERLAQWADVVVENFRPGVADKLGVGYETLKKIKPNLVYVSISGYGQKGVEPYTKLPGYDLVIQGIGGIAALTGPEDGAPYKVGTSIADLTAGLNAFGGALAALYARERTGKGEHVDISMLDGQLSLLSYHASAILNANTAPERLGNAHPSICPYETFAAADGYINIACGNDGQFEKFCGVIGAEELVRDERFATNAVRVENRSALLEILAPILKARPLEEWIEKIKGAGVPCGPILPATESLSHPQVAARGTVITDEHPVAGTVKNVGAPMGFGLKSYADSPAPLCGEHTEIVLRDVCDFSDDEIEGFKKAGAVSVL
ncbi:MAG: hypothetical protein CMH60_03615 [Myxococcales bacterium]|nr:hypothetical protein [Myxococcales bacterium]